MKKIYNWLFGINKETEMKKITYEEFINEHSKEKKYKGVTLNCDDFKDGFALPKSIKHLSSLTLSDKNLIDNLKVLFEGGYEIVEGYKAFNINTANSGKKFLNCLDTAFFVNDFNLLQNTGSLQKCRNGYHFCKELGQINTHYNFLNDLKTNKGDIVVAKIKAFKFKNDIEEIDLKRHLDKEVTRLFVIEEFYSSSELKDLVKEEFLKEMMPDVNKIVDRYPETIITGGLSHIILDLKTPSSLYDIHDLDFVFEKYIPKKELLKELNPNKSIERPKPLKLSDMFSAEECASYPSFERNCEFSADNANSSGMPEKSDAYSISYKRNGSDDVIGIDIYFKSISQWVPVEINGRTYKVALPWDALEYKLNYVKSNTGTSLKHAEDLSEILSNISNLDKYRS